MSSDPRRLVDYGDSLRDVVRNALDAERAADDAEAARLARIEAKLLAALGAAPVPTTPPAPEPPAPSPPAAPPSAPPPATAPSSWLGAKGAVAVGAAAVVIGAAFFLARPTSTSSSSVTPSLVPSAAETAPKTPDRDPAPAAAPPPIKTVSPSELPTVVDPPTKTAPSAREPATGTAASSAADTEEIALLARAHDALRASPAESLELCRQHERKFANGRFSQEREAVAIEALVHLGRRDEAEKRWSSFQARFPGSSHRVHLQSLFTTSPTNPAPPAR